MTTAFVKIRVECQDCLKVKTFKVWMLTTDPLEPGDSWDVMPCPDCDGHDWIVTKVTECEPDPIGQGDEQCE